MIFNSLLNFIFSPILSLPSYLSIFLVSLFFTSIMVFVNKKFLWNKDVRNLQKKMKEIDKRIDILKKEGKRKLKKESKKLLEKQSE
ncbi:MAG: EMC3/TMCO1 family protein, partial [Candidatus Aenigmarchaeota archaeon]|nr:EMC3/TMCO1 family protein [Candidatus Aenigmarchaeota archaeon]